MFQQPPVGDEAFDPRWAAPYALDVNGNRVPLLTTAAGYALDPVIQYHPGHYIAGGGSGGVIHSPTVTLPGGVTVYIPNAQQEPISSDASQYQLPSTQVCVCVCFDHAKSASLSPKRLAPFLLLGVANHYY